MQIVYWIYRGLVSLIDEIRIGTQCSALFGLELHLLIYRDMNLREGELPMEILT